MLTLADLFEALALVRPERARHIAIPQVVVDSRLVKAGSLFVALKGQTRDGHEFIPDALERGAAAIIAEASVGGQVTPVDSASFEREQKRFPLVQMRQGLTQVQWVDASGAGVQPDASRAPASDRSERDKPPERGERSTQSLVPALFVVASSLKALQRLAAFWRRRFPQCQAIGVTGSVGKSSTKELIASVLRQRFGTLKSEGNLNNEIGLPLTLLRLNETHERVTVEMGMYALGEIRDLCQIALPRIGVVTNVGPVHLERLGTVDRIARAKAELVEALPADGAAVLNGDDARVIAMKDKTRARVFCYGLDPHCDLWADQIESIGLEGIAFVLHRGEEHLHVRIPLLGRHSVHTGLAAASVGLIEGLSWEQILRGLRDVSAQLRLIAVPGEMGATILDDTYNASPASSLAALNLLADLSERKIAVLGDMLELGQYEEQGHQVVGGRAAQVVDVLIAVGLRGRKIGEAARDAGLPKERLFFAEGNSQAIALLRRVIRAGDMVLVKGSRGAMMEEIVATLARPPENGSMETREWRGP